MAEKKRASSDRRIGTWVKERPSIIRGAGMWAKKRPRFVTPGRRVVEIREMYFWILSTLAVGAFITWIMWYLKGLGHLTGTAVDHSIWEVFFAVFGLMYAIIVGLFLVESFRRWGVLSSTIHSEINAIGDIHDCLKYFDDSEENLRVKEDIKESLRDYVGKIIEADWERMQDPRGDETKERHKRWGPIFRDLVKTSSKEYRIKQFKDKGVRPIIDHVEKLQPSGGSAEHAQEVIIDRVCEITTHRVNRLELAQHGVSAGLYVIILFMSLVIVGATWMLNVPNNEVHIFIVFSTSVALTALFRLLIDLDHPFTGFFRIEKGILDDIEEKLEGENKE